jgi:hypothetical protein
VPVESSSDFHAIDRVLYLWVQFEQKTLVVSITQVVITLSVTFHLLPFVKCSVCNMHTGKLMHRTKNNSINLHAQILTALHPSVFISRIHWLMFQTSNGLTFHIPPLPRPEIFLSVNNIICRWVFFNKPVIWMWLSYSKPSLRQSKKKVRHWEILCVSPERYKKSPRRQQVGVWPRIGEWCNLFVESVVVNTKWSNWSCLKG